MITYFVEKNSKREIYLLGSIHNHVAFQDYAEELIEKVMPD